MPRSLALAGLLAAALAPGCATNSPSTSESVNGETGTSGSSTASTETSAESTTSTSETSETETSGDGDGDGAPPELPSVLFIGNSYTFVNDLPGLVQTMSAGSSMPLEVASLTMGGARVSDHLANPQLAILLGQGFDVVVIQGQSFEPILDYPGFEQAVVELVSMTGDARVLLYQTWPRKDGSPDLIDLGMTVDEMWAGLEGGYANAALASDSEVASVGGAFMSALQLDPPIELYSPDQSHPSVAGTYLAGCVFFDMIVGMACATSNYAPPDLPPEDVERLQVIADITTGIVNPGP